VAADSNPFAAPAGDRRRDERRLFRGGALWAPAGSSPMQARTLDLSLTGIALVSQINPTIGCRCRVRFALPTHEGASLTVDMIARVVRASFSGAEDGFRVGIEFDSLEPEAERALKRFVGGT
jgi:c-di-GMP-binding flagellar brake protein YcgR